MTALYLAPDTTARRPAPMSRGLNLVSRMYRTWKNRREFYRLGEMTDAELQDIGLTRTDLFVAIASPYALDPTTRLRSIVEERLRTE